MRRRVARIRRWLQKLAPQSALAWRERQRATWDRAWWTALDTIEASQSGLPPADVDLPLEFVDRLEALIREAGPDRALALIECGRDAALSYVTAEVGAFDLAWLAECARSSTPALAAPSAVPGAAVP